MHMNIIDNYVFVLLISLHPYCTEATGFSHIIVWSAPPDTEKNQPTSAYFSNHTASCRISLFVTPDCYVLSYIRLVIGPQLPFIAGFSPMHGFPATLLRRLRTGKSLHLCTHSFGPIGCYEMK